MAKILIFYTSHAGGLTISSVFFGKTANRQKAKFERFWKWESGMNGSCESSRSESSHTERMGGLRATTAAKMVSFFSHQYTTDN